VDMFDDLSLLSLLLLISFDEKEFF